MGAIAYGVARRRPPGIPLTWGQAFVAALFVFVFFLVVYAVVPNQWLQYADSNLKWRPDKIGIPFGISVGHYHVLGLHKPYRLLSKGLRFAFLPGGGRIIITAQAVRDVIASLIYLAALAGQAVIWLVWQRRGQVRPGPRELPRSAFGRPLVRKV